MRILSPILKRLVYPGLARTNLLGKRTGVAVLTYHGVTPVGYKILDPILDGALITRERLRQHFEVLQKRYCVVSPEEFLATLRAGRPFAPNSVLLTCDDGLRNNVTEMLPVLDEFGFKCLFFITGASAVQHPSLLWQDELFLMLRLAPKPQALRLDHLLGATRGGALPWATLTELLAGQNACQRRNTLAQIREQVGLSSEWLAAVWNDEILASRFQLLSPEGLRQLAVAGMSIGAHSMSHPALSQLSNEEAQAEIADSLTEIVRALGNDVWAFAYPYGNGASVGRRDVRLAQAAGFECAFMNVDGGLGAALPRFALPRLHIPGDMTIAELEVHVSGAYRSFRNERLRMPPAGIRTKASLT
jgi:peptidoglycan/xylan/chitin deacetylase (PgdA/CDA1 family)